MGVGWGEVREGREREKRKAGGAKRERVPVPVLGVERVRREVPLGVGGVLERGRERYRSGRCSPLARMVRIRSRY